MNIKIIACEVMREELLQVQPAKSVSFEFVSMGLHLYPDKLAQELQRLITVNQGYDRIILGFGLCGGAAKELRAGDSLLLVPRVHDCISVLLGSRARFDQYRQEIAGTLYLSRGWLQGERSILSEYQRVFEKYGLKKAEKIFRRIYSGYERMLYIQTGSLQEEKCLEKFFAIQKLLNLTHQIVEGQGEFIRKIVNGPWSESDFIQTQPGGKINERDFYKIERGRVLWQK